MKILEKLFPLWAVVIVGLIIVLNSFGVFPAGIFFALVVLVAGTALAVMRPALGFGIFLATIPLEYVPLVSAGGMDLRWYQVMGTALAMGLLIRSIVKKECAMMRMWPFSVADWAVIVILISGFVSAIFGGGGSMKQAVVFASFVFLYFLVRHFVRGRKDAQGALPYLVGSFVVVAVYGIVQNVLFVQGFTHLEVMPGRPNATFQEADWLGLYTALGAVLTSLLVWKAMAEVVYDSKKGMALRVFTHELCVLAFMVLIITVARSAWLSGLAGLAVVGIGLWVRYGFQKMRGWGVRMGVLFAVAMGIVWAFHLTSFELGNRVQSIGSGQQEITMACPGGMIFGALPERVEDSEDFPECEHIDLESIDAFTARGYNVFKVYRDDPNAQVRKDNWRISMSAIRENPVLGIGWGNIGEKLGVDERGASLNSSNIFLEFWLGSGIVGFLGIVFVFGYLLWKGAQKMTHDLRPTTHDEMRSVMNDTAREGNFNFLFFVGLSALTVTLLMFNLFNSAHFLGIVWVTLAFLVALTHTNESVR